MYDSVKTTTRKPPFSLTDNYLDFGGVEFKKNGNNSRTLVTSLTNHIKKDIEVIWEFGINPTDIISFK